ncbi:MAG: radical SAM protein [Acidimicrobiia bacterium]|nr:radical SAM protein [Acidimicrobiia bacterium]
MAYVVVAEGPSESTDDGADGERTRLSAAVLVALRTTGVQLPALGDGEIVPLGIDGLDFLCELASPDGVDLGSALGPGEGAGDETPSEVVDPRRAIIDRLTAVGLLLPVGVAPPDAPGSHPFPVHTVSDGPAGGGTAIVDGHAGTEGAATIDVTADGAGVATDLVDASDPGLEWYVVTPLLWWISPEGYATGTHDGAELLRLGAIELAAAGCFAKRATLDAAHARHVEEVGDRALDRDTFAALHARLRLAGLMRVASGDDPASIVEEREAANFRRAISTQMRLRGAVDRRLGDRGIDDPRVPVVPIHRMGNNVPLGLGMIMAYLMAWEDEKLCQHYNFLADWTASDRPPEVLAKRDSVFLISNYMWSSEQNLAVCAALKAANPNHVMIHGGPDTPKYPGDVDRYFAAHPHVDVAIHGEGEQCAVEAFDALAAAFVRRTDGEPVDLSVLADVPGLSYRTADGVVRTADRPRLTELNVIPSPYVTGLFDAYAEAQIPSVTIETNRGCPYGCTFCDWGTSTLSRIRKFDLDRVFAELEWVANNQIMAVSFADANFGIFERDVEIAEHVAELKADKGFPAFCAGTYAKNTVKHLKRIISTWVDAGIVTEGILSLQSMDEGTLASVNRSNIRTDRYDDLAREFRKAKMPLKVDLMMGLPGATYASFLRDLQSCVDREVSAKIHETTLLVNSPMNAPDYREEHGITTAPDNDPTRANTEGTRRAVPGLVVVATNTMGPEDFIEMRRLKRFFTLSENFGVLRHVSRYVRYLGGPEEAAFYDQLRLTAVAQPERFPAVAFFAHAVHGIMAPPVTWQRFIDDVGAFVVDDLGLADDSGLRTVLAVQHALLPSPVRRFPTTLELAHDYPSWHDDMLAAKQETFDWEPLVAPLVERPPVVFTVTDPRRISELSTGNRLGQAWFENWEMDSPVAMRHEVEPAPA